MIMCQVMVANRWPFLKHSQLPEQTCPFLYIFEYTNGGAADSYSLGAIFYDLALATIGILNVVDDGKSDGRIVKISTKLRNKLKDMYIEPSTLSVDLTVDPIGKGKKQFILLCRFP